MTVGPDRGLTHIVQSAGRVGRRDRVGYYLLLLASAHSSSTIAKFRNEITIPSARRDPGLRFQQQDLDAMERLTMQRTSCLRDEIAKFMDGQSATCLGIDSLCSSCIHRSD